MDPKLLERNIIHCDETPIQVLKEDGKEPQTMSYMWLNRTGNDEELPSSSMITDHQGMVIIL
ncbi:MAG: transposase [Clostridiales bacterium]|nr:transposase [Clostridiales bacterium]